MGTIAEKLLYLDDTKTAIRDAINALGGELAVDSPFRSYVDEVWRPFFTETLFGAGEIGIWYDPSDISTLFQDSRGSVPVTASGQPVGLILDKSKGLQLGPDLVVNGGFDSSDSWAENGPIISGGVASFSGQFRSLEQTLAVENDKYYKLEFEVLAMSGSEALAVSSSGFGLVSDIFIPKLGVNERIIFCKDSTKPLRLIQPYTGTSITIDNVKLRHLPGNHATQNIAGAKPIYRSVAGQQHLEFDGVQDFLETGPIDFSGTTKLIATVALEKLRSAGREMLIELSPTVATPGTFNIDHSQNIPGAFAATISADNPGGATVNAASAIGKSVVSASFDTSAADTLSKIKIYLNGEEQSTALLGNPDAGSGDLHKHSLYIGSRGGTSLYFQGSIYGMVIRAGGASTVNLERIHKYAGTKSGVLIP